MLSRADHIHRTLWLRKRRKRSEYCSLGIDQNDYLPHFDISADGFIAGVLLKNYQGLLTGKNYYSPEFSHEQLIVSAASKQPILSRKLVSITMVVSLLSLFFDEERVKA